jgi:translocation and assembly module TamB
MQIKLGTNSVNLRGHRAQHSDLELQLDAPDLQMLWPELAGSLAGRIRLRGTLAEPLLDGELQGQNLALAAWRLNQLDLSLQPPDETGQQRLSLQAGQARRSDNLVFSGVELDGRGRVSDHQLNWAVERADHRLQGTLDGGLTNADWQGQLEQLHLSGPLSKAWAQTEPARLSASAEQFRVSELCLQAREHSGRTCTRGDWQAPDQGSLDLSLTAIPLAPLAALLPPGASLEGDLNGNAALTLEAGQPRGSVELATGQGALLLGADRDEPVQVPWQQFRARARVAEGQWRLDTSLQRSETDFVDGHVAGELGASNGALEGRLETSLSDLSWLELVVPQLREPEGSLEGRLTLSGTTENPAFKGHLALRDARVRVPQAGLVLRRMQMSATSEQGRLHFDGSARSGDGQVRLNGRLNTDEAWPWPLQLHLEGERFLALDRPDARLVLDPDLDFTLEGRRLSLRGDVGVPAARFQPRQLGSQAVQLSSDAHLVHQEEQAQPPWKTDIDVGVKLGDEVHFQGFGLEARFGGEVRYRDPADQVPRMTGEVRVEQGRYRAYGQRLQIERGRLLFEGAPDNPGLDIIAVRPLPNQETRVGLEVGGTLQEPNARVFSEPALEQSEAMALLLTGRPLSGTSRAESDAILQAITRYGLERGEFLTNPLNEKLGVEVGVDSSNELDRTALTLGKQLSERLYVQYSMGLFQSLSTVMLRYSITPRLSLETRSSGESQGADLIYRLQAD